MKGKKCKEKQDKYKMMQHNEIRKDAVAENDTGIISAVDLSNFSHLVHLWRWHSPELRHT